MWKTGDWQPVWDIYDHPTSEPEKTFEAAIEGFQKRFGLQTDGLMVPGGPTETTLRAETARTKVESGDLPALGNPLTLKKSVGVGQPNDPQDVVPLQTALGRIANPKVGLDPLLGTPPTLHAFQSKLGLKPDGVMHPGGPTEAKINALATPLLAAAAASTEGRSVQSPIQDEGDPGHAQDDPYQEARSRNRHEPSVDSCRAARMRVLELQHTVKDVERRAQKYHQDYISAESEFSEAVEKFKDYRDSISQPGGVTDLCDDLKLRRFSKRVNGMISLGCQIGYHFLGITEWEKKIEELREKKTRAHNVWKIEKTKRDSQKMDLERARQNLSECESTVYSP